MEHGTVLDHKYVAHRVIRAGGFGTVWRGVHLRTGAPIAIKVAPKREGTSVLVHEARFMMYLERCRRVPSPKIRGYGTHPSDADQNYIAMDLLGDCLSRRNVMRAFYRRHPQTECRESEPILSVFLADVCAQLHRIVEGIHSTGFVYRDVKPSNFLFGREDSVEGDDGRERDTCRVRVHVVDFGMAKRYADAKEARADEGAARKAPVGTPHYMSIGAHECAEHTRRDDLESLAYLFYYIHVGSLPWEALDDHVALAEAKRRFRWSAELRDLHNVRHYLERVDALGPADRPNYKALEAILSYIVVF